MASAGEVERGETSQRVRGAGVVENEQSSDIVQAVAGGFYGGDDCGRGDLVCDSGAGAGGTADDSSVSVWEPEREQEWI